MNKRQKRIIQLLDSHGTQLHKLLCRLTLREDVVGDLMQELFIKLSESRKINQIDNLYAYAWKTATNLAFAWRKEQKYRYPSLSKRDEPVDDCSNPLVNMVREEEFNLVLDAISKLNELTRNAVILRFLEQASYEEIARRLKKKPQHMRTLCSKGIAQLKYLLSKDKSHTEKGRYYHGKYQ